MPPIRKFRLQQSTFEEMLDELAAIVEDRGPHISNERSETDWSLDPHDEDDRNAFYVFNRTGLNPNNSVHRDLLLEWLLSWAPVPGDPGIPDTAKFRLLLDVDTLKKNFADNGLASSDEAACIELARLNRKHNCTPETPLGGMSAKSIQGRYYRVKREFKQRLPLERFQRNYSDDALDNLHRILGVPTTK